MYTPYDGGSTAVGTPRVDRPHSRPARSTRRGEKNRALGLASARERRQRADVPGLPPGGGGGGGGGDDGGGDDDARRSARQNILRRVLARFKALRVAGSPRDERPTTSGPRDATRATDSTSGQASASAATPPSSPSTREGTSGGAGSSVKRRRDARSPRFDPPRTPGRLTTPQPSPGSGSPPHAKPRHK